jgi:hypothetical protein
MILRKSKQDPDKKYLSALDFSQGRLSVFDITLRKREGKQ